MISIADVVRDVLDGGIPQGSEHLPLAEQIAASIEERIGRGLCCCYRFVLGDGDPCECDCHDHVCGEDDA